MLKFGRKKARFQAICVQILLQTLADKSLIMYADPSGRFGILTLVTIIVASMLMGGAAQLVSNAITGKTGGKFLSVFTKHYGQKILLQNIIGAGLSGTINFIKKNDWSKHNLIIPVPVLPLY